MQYAHQNRLAAAGFAQTRLGVHAVDKVRDGYGAESVLL